MADEMRQLPQGFPTGDQGPEVVVTETEFLLRILRGLMETEAEYRSAMHIYKDHPSHPRRLRAEAMWGNAKSVAKCVLGGARPAIGLAMTATETAPGTNSREPAMAETQGWQPIETAPRDGSMILARNAAHGFMYVVGWQPAYEGHEEDHWDDVGNQNCAPALYFNANYFQHWQPLPEAPGI